MGTGWGLDGMGMGCGVCVECLKGNGAEWETLQEKETSTGQSPSKIGSGALSFRLLR